MKEILLFTDLSNASIVLAVFSVLFGVHLINLNLTNIWQANVMMVGEMQCRYLYIFSTSER